MSEKKRMIVTTIETHEVWIIKRTRPENPIETEVVVPDEITQPPGISPPSEVKDGTEITKEQEP